MLNLVEFEWEIIDLGGEAPHTREELEEKKRLAQEKEWEIPAFLRKRAS